MKVQSIMGQGNNVNNQKQNQMSSISTGYMSHIGMKHGDQVSFGTNWKSMGNEILSMGSSELLEMAEHFHKSSIDDIRAVSSSSSIFGASKKQTNAFAKLYDAVNEVKNYKYSSYSVSKRMDERAAKVEEIYGDKPLGPDDYYPGYTRF